MDVTDKIRPWMKECRLCPRNCGADRMAGQKGFCGTDTEIMVARAALHMWEEPCISGKEGSGAVFFSRMFAGMQFLSEQKNIQGPEGKEDYTGTPGRTFFSIAGAGGK